MRTSKPSKSDWDQIIIWVSPKLNRPTLIFLSYSMKQLTHVVGGALRKHKSTNVIHLMYGSKRNSWFFFPESLRKYQVSLENKTNQFPLRPYIKCFVIFPLNNHMTKTRRCIWLVGNNCVIISWLDHTFEFYQGHVTKNQPITVLILLSESLGI